jgi:hypothetical protein
VLSRLPLLEPLSKGIANALFSIAAASLGGYFFFNAVPLASPDLLRSIATIGAALLLGYIVEAVWLVRQGEKDEEFEEWLGFTVGAAIAGFLGVIFALLLAEHRVVGHANFIDKIGVAWVAVSLLILGGSLIAHPLLAHRLVERIEPGDEVARDRPGGVGSP